MQLISLAVPAWRSTRALPIAIGLTLAGCVGGGPSQTTDALPAGALVPHLSGSQVSKAQAAQGLLYVSDFSANVVYVYRLGRYKEPIGTITSGLHSPKGTAVDSSGNLYVDNPDAKYETGDVVVYPPGTSQPSRQLWLSYGADDPGGLAVAKDGTVYVVVACCSNEIAIFSPGGSSPSGYLTMPSGVSPYFTTVDKNGNVFVSGWSTGYNGGVWEFKHGTGSAIDLNLQGLGQAAAGGIVVDNKGNLVVSSRSNKAIDIYPKGSTTYSRQMSLASTPYGIAFTKDYKQLFVSCDSNVVYVVDYSTGQVSKTISGFELVETPAVSPAAGF
jgi:hypothetical protein